MKLVFFVSMCAGTYVWDAGGLLCAMMFLCVLKDGRKASFSSLEFRASTNWIIFFPPEQRTKSSLRSLLGQVLVLGSRFQGLNNMKIDVFSLKPTFSPMRLVHLDSWYQERRFPARL